MTLHAVGTYAQDPGPVAVFLHGWGSDEQDLAGLAGYLPRGLAWASVRAPLRHPSFGYAWYPLESEDSWDRQAPIDAATDALWTWADAELQDRPLIAIGFSQGGLMASQLLRTHPDRLTGTVILSGYVLPSTQRADAVLAESRPPVFWGRGDADFVIPPHAIAATEEFLPAHSTLEAHVYTGVGHNVSEQELGHLRTFVESVTGP
ncbi:alpha/beta hydrolase [Demequina sp.]|uniref:alpha/beta hydrolase n=1 Tax=Demequina sp. TaxID=2050685 RepID=UPI003D0E1A04